jgi:DNA-binding PadR family transcriptional regulator
MALDFLRPLYRGFIRLHILYHAGKEPICGTELMEELREHGYEIGPGTLYPMLHQMQAAGLLASSHQIVDGKRRKNVRSTAAGRAALQQARAKLKELAAEVLDDRDARQLRRKK